MKKRENLGYLKCTKCGWIHFAVSRDYAEEEVSSFNRYYESLTPIQQEENYGGRKSDISSYEHCFRCGTHHEQAVKATNEEVPNGSTIQPMISPTDYPKIKLK